MATATKTKRARTEDLHQIGEVAELVGLSLRTVRYYEEVGVLSAPARTEGGFRLYGSEHIDQLLLIKQMKPLGLSLDEMRALLEARDTLRTSSSARRKSEARAQLESFADTADERCVELKDKLRNAERFAAEIRGEAETNG
ncbi:MAG TPA: MerR family transcriptional regulator [Solirubrobacterales bacterium]|jgi:DNA-binding transcriptional MerR regulator|nr:MerR family transcriptional regulator [Solirubrobacterales bacterium]